MYGSGSPWAIGVSVSAVRAIALSSPAPMCASPQLDEGAASHRSGVGIPVLDRLEALLGASPREQLGDEGGLGGDVDVHVAGSETDVRLLQVAIALSCLGVLTQ